MQKLTKMGACASKKEHNPYKKQIKALREKVKFLEREVNRIRAEKEKERRTYQREMLILTLKRKETKTENKRLKNDVKMLMENSALKNNEKMENECDVLMLVEEKEKLEKRDCNEAAMKWKKLYFDIKNELDDLIRRTRQGEKLYTKANEEENMMQEVYMQLKSKEETIQVLKEQLASMVKDEIKKEREGDILRQSLRILSLKPPAEVSNKTCK